MAELTLIAKGFTEEFRGQLTERVREVEKRTGRKARFLRFSEEHESYHNKFLSPSSCDCKPGIYDNKTVQKALIYLYRMGNQDERQKAAEQLGYKAVRFTIHELLLEKGLPCFGI